MSLKSIIRRAPGIAAALTTGNIAGAVVAGFGPPRGGMSPARFGGYPGFDWRHPTRGLPGFMKPGGFKGKGGRVDPENGTCPRGYHLNKHKLADGTEARSVCVRNRSMNVLNGRAAARAVARVKRAEKMVRKLKLFKPVHRLALGKPCGHRGNCTCK